MSPLARFFLADWRRKLLALLLAFGLWWYVDGLIAVERGYTLRVVVAEGRFAPEDGTLTVLVPPGWTLVDPKPGSSVAVRLRGSRSNLQEFTSRQFAAFHELRNPAGDEPGAQPAEPVRPADLEWRRPDEAEQLLVRDEGATITFRVERMTQHSFAPTPDLLRVISEVRPEYEVRLHDAGFDLTTATLSGPEGLVNEAEEEILRAALEPGSGASLFEPIRLEQTTRFEAKVMLRLDESWAARGLRMDPDWIRTTIPIRLKLESVHEWAPRLRVLQDEPKRWLEPTYAARWRAELRYDALDAGTLAGTPFKEWIEVHVLLILPLDRLRAESLQVAGARVEWVLIDVDDDTRAALRDALVVQPVDPDDWTVTVSRAP